MKNFLFPVSAGALATALLMAGCATRKYQAQPISPPQTAAAFEARTLDSPGLKEFVEANRQVQDPWPPPAWDLGFLTLAAFYYHPDLDVARAQIRSAEAAVITAGTRPNPSLNVASGPANFPEGIPWTFAFDLALPVETARRRQLRVDQAKQLTEVARLQLAETAWQVRARLRGVLLEHLLAQRQLQLLHGEQAVRSGILGLVERRVAAGEAANPDGQAARIDLANLSLEIQSAERQVEQTRAALAEAIGVPVAALEGISLSWPALEHPPGVQSLSPAEIQREAVLNRIDLRRSLAEYAAAEAGLRLEIAQQHPGFQWGPAYEFAEGASRFLLGAGMPLPIFNRNQGPIAEAEARRKETASRFLALQAEVIGESQRALAGYRASLVKLDEATKSLVRLQSEKENMVRVSFAAGESDALVLRQAQAEGYTAQRAWWDALHTAETALGDLENAVQRPLGPGEAYPEPSAYSSPSGRQKENKP